MTNSRRDSPPIKGQLSSLSGRPRRYSCLAVNGQQQNSRFLALLIAAIVLAVPSLASAGGFWLPGHGATPLGRGGAVVASSDDPNGIWYNPATLVRNKGNQLLIDVAMIDLSADFTRADRQARDGSTVTYETVKNEGMPQWIPQLLFSSDLGTDEFALAVGAYAPNAPRYRFPEDGPQRYSIVDNTESLILYEHLAFAWRPHPRFAVGAGIQNMMAVLDSTFMGSSYVGLWGEPEDYDLDLMIHIKATDLLTITGNFGVWGEPVDGLTLGASVQAPAAVQDDEAKLEVRLPSHYAFDNASVDGDKMVLSIDLPWIFRAGVGYGVEHVFDVELDVVYETWSVHQAIHSDPKSVNVRNVPTVGSLEVGALNVQRDFQNTLGVGLGGEYTVVPEMLDLRAGFMFEQGAIPDKTFSLFQVDSQKFAPTLGASLSFADFSVDLAYSFIYQVSRDITTSEVAQVNPTYDAGSTIVGNGSTSSFFNVLAMGARYAF